MGVKGVEHGLIDLIWPCNCIICKYFTKPLLRLLLKNELEELSKQLEKRRLKEVSYMAEEAPGEVTVELKKEVEELKRAVNGLKNAIAELRASLTDLTSPYALLKSIPPIPSPTTETPRETSVENSSRSLEISKEASSTKGPKVVKIKVPPKPQPPPPKFPKKQLEEFHPMKGSPILYKQAPYEEEKKTVSLEELREMLRELGEVVSEEERSTAKPKLDIRRVIYILKTIYNLRKALPRESIDNIIKLAEILGLITSTDREILNTIGSLVEDALKQDLTPDEQVLVLYVLLKNLGYIDEALEEEIIRIVSDVVISRRKIVDTIENIATKRKRSSLKNSNLNKPRSKEDKLDEDSRSERRG